MSRIPSYPFRCIVIRTMAGGNQQMVQFNHSTLSAAWADRDDHLKKSNTRKVEILAVLDETTPSHRVNAPLTSSIRSFRVDES